MHILIVDDDQDNRTILTTRLQRRGFKISTAKTGIEGLMLALQLKPDLILMDMSMPELHGWGATAQLKASPQTRAIPVIAITAYNLAGDRQRCLAVGCDGYVEKPIDFAYLLSTIQLVAERHKLAFEIKLGG
ncbi:response regulator [Herpetosiphon sp. NSE202]|uniref:response regulator n=1 Tax=Herpetosiphon sp. NSE202 TaxID=3351349 RepID=UPI003624B042